MLKSKAWTTAFCLGPQVSGSVPASDTYKTMDFLKIDNRSSKINSVQTKSRLPFDSRRDNCIRRFCFHCFKQTCIFWESSLPVKRDTLTKFLSMLFFLALYFLLLDKRVPFGNSVPIYCHKHNLLVYDPFARSSVNCQSLKSDLY